MNLTPRQLDVLVAIRNYRHLHGYSPTMQELADEIGVSKVTVFEHVEALIKKGALVREPNKARSLSIADGIAVPDEARPLHFPLVGKIAAGYPIEKIEDPAPAGGSSKTSRPFLPTSHRKLAFFPSENSSSFEALLQLG